MTNSNQTHKGALLRQTREAQGVSLETVHEATKIPMDALRAIEEGYNVRILSPFYYKAFMKKYAQYLNIPVESVLDEDEEKKEKKPGVLASLPTPRKAAPEPKPKPLAGPVESESKGAPTWFTRQRQQQILIGVCVFIALFLVIKVFGFIRNAFVKRSSRPAVERTAATKVKKPAVVQSQKKMVRPKVPPTAAPAPVATAAAPGKPAPASAQTEKPAVTPVKTTITGPINLTVRAKRNSWLQVRADGIVVFQSTLSKGDVENWTADDKIEISGKNINDLEFELNGKLISSLGKSDRQARRLIITKDGLSIKN